MESERENFMSGPAHILGVFVVPVALAFAIIAVVITSEVNLNLWLVKGAPAAVVAVAYAFLLLLTVARPLNAMFHLIGSPAAAFVFIGRGGGFIELALDRGSWALFGAISERLALGIIVVAWHTYRIHQSGLAGSGAESAHIKRAERCT